MHRRCHRSVATTAQFRREIADRVAQTGTLPRRRDQASCGQKGLEQRSEEGTATGVPALKDEESVIERHNLRTAKLYPPHTRKNSRGDRFFRRHRVSAVM